MCLGKRKTMFSKEEIDKISEAHQIIKEFDKRLITYCEPIAQKLGWSYVDAVTFANNYVHVSVSWFGPYQSENHDVITFPTSWLVKDPEEIANMLYLEQQAKNILEKEKQDQCLKNKALVMENIKAKLTDEEKKALGL